MVDHLLREWPPGFGGVERVAHELATIWGGTVFSLDVRSISFDTILCPCLATACLTTLLGVCTSLLSRSLWTLLRSSTPLYGISLTGCTACLGVSSFDASRRQVTAHWHCFLEPGRGFTGSLYAAYQWIALRLLSQFSAVVTTSPILAQELQRCGCPERHVFVLPCSLSPQQEQLCLALPIPRTVLGDPLRLLFIGRLDSYKRIDWLLEVLAQLTSPWQLSVVGDGPKRQLFEDLAQRLFPTDSPVRFHGCLSETAKLEQLAEAEVLVLPSDRSNEAFGIVQLEAMAAGRVALAFEQTRSGVGWVGRLSGLPWSQSRYGLTEVLQRLADQPALRQQLCSQARERYITLFSRRVWLQQLYRLGNLVERRKVCNFRD